MCSKQQELEEAGGESGVRADRLPLPLPSAAHSQLPPSRPERAAGSLHVAALGAAALAPFPLHAAAAAGPNPAPMPPLHAGGRRGALHVIQEPREAGGAGATAAAGGPHDQQLQVRALLLPLRLPPLCLPAMPCALPVSWLPPPRLPGALWQTERAAPHRFRAASPFADHWPAAFIDCH